MKENYFMINTVLVLVIVFSFFLPWVHVESQVVGKMTKVLTGKQQAEIDNVSGFAIPGLANGPDARLMISIIKIFAPGVKDADKKSWFVWAVPFLAIAIFFLSMYKGNGARFIQLDVAMTCIIIYLIGFYKLKTTDLDKMVLNVRIGIGMWFTLWSFLCLGVVNLLMFLQSMRNK